jgi:Flp pilus assembly protein TadB
MRTALLVVGAAGASLCWLALAAPQARSRFLHPRVHIGSRWVVHQQLALRQADLAWIPAWAWVLARIIGPAVAGAIAYLFFHIAVLAALAVVAVHHVLGLLLELRRRRAESGRRAALLDSIRYGVAMMGRAGNALQRVTALAETGPFEARGIFRDVIDRMAGDGATSLASAIAAEQDELADPLFDDFALAMALHSQYGGRLVPALDALVKEWDETLVLHREAKSMRAGVEASVLLLSLLPFAFLLILQALAPTLLQPFASVGGEILLALAVAWMILGYRVLQAMSAPPREERLRLAGTA